MRIRLVVPVLVVALGLSACSAPVGPEPAASVPEPASESAQPTPAQPRPALSPLGREAYERLRAAPRFTDDGIYDGGITPNEVRAMRILWTEPDAAAAFARLEQEATLPGRLYALCGLWYSDRERFDERIDAYRGSTDVVFFQTGCVGFRDWPVADLVELESPEAVRLERTESVRAWLAERDNPNGSAGGYRYDIVGGGWPDLFRTGGGWAEVSIEPFSPYAD